jgi:uncharacterized membrane protein YdbT with pleckstrin-like domain
MSKEMSRNSSSVLWRGKPWILPGLMARSILVVAFAVIVSWLELQFDVAAKSLFIMPLALWTGLVIFLIWVLSLIHLLSLRVSSTYILRSDGLEVRTGVFSSKSFVVAPAGFSDLEVVRSVSARIVNSGSILIRTQGETNIRMERVRNASRVADQIREVMARPIVRIEGQNVAAEK